jgi:hypothetical protein
VNQELNVMSEQPSDGSAFLTVSEAADFLRLRRRTLDNLRWAGGGPRYQKHGGRVVYARRELQAWSAARTKESTSVDAPKTARE